MSKQRLDSKDRDMVARHNTFKAERIGMALKPIYGDSTCLIQDAIADLMHLADLQLSETVDDPGGFEGFDEALLSAAYDYAAETKPDGLAIDGAQYWASEGGDKPVTEKAGFPVPFVRWVVVDPDGTEHWVDEPEFIEAREGATVYAVDVVASEIGRRLYDDK